LPPFHFKEYVMILDSQNTFCTALSVARAVGDAVSTDVYDTGAAADTGIGENFYVFAKMDAALVGAGASIQVVLQDSADNSAWADAEAGRVIGVAAAVANSDLARLRVPLGLRRYLRVVFRISGATTTGGTASAMLTLDVQAQQYGASGFSVA
jgi:hypothetical protein